MKVNGFFRKKDGKEVRTRDATMLAAVRDVGETRRGIERHLKKYNKSSLKNSSLNLPVLLSVNEVPRSNKSGK